MPSTEEQGAAYRIGAGIEPRAQPGIGIKDVWDMAWDMRNFNERKRLAELDVELANRQFDEMMRQFQTTSGATADWRQAQLGQQYAQMAQTGAYQQQGLQQRWAEMEMQRQQQAALLAQRKREMGASIGQGIAGLQAQTWAQGMPYQLPKGTMFAPGFGPGGPVSEMARRAGVSYVPQRVPQAPPPSRKEMEQWIEAAIAKFS